MTLKEAYATHKPLKFSFMIDAYESLIGMIGGAESVRKLVEIGVWKGNSLRMWHDALPNARIIGVDIPWTVSAFKLREDRIEVMIADQSNPEQLSEVSKEAMGADIVVDDGSHKAKDQIDAFLALYRHVRPGGLYVCEDVFLNYNEHFTTQNEPTMLDLASEIGCYLQIKAVNMPDIARYMQIKDEDLQDLKPSNIFSVIAGCAYGRRKSTISMDVVEQVTSSTKSVMFFQGLVAFQKGDLPCSEST